LAASLFALAAAVPASAEPFNNDSVLALTRAGVGSTVLLAKVNSLPCGYDVSTPAIICLQKAGVPEKVIAAMVDRCAGSTRAQGAEGNSDDPMVRRTPGLYVARREGDRSVLRAIRPTVVTGSHVSGNGSVLFPYISRLDVAQPAAQTVLDTASPGFYFYFDAQDRKVGDFGEALSASAQSPAEFTLVRFKAVKGMREMVVGRMAGIGGETGMDPRNTIAFSQTEMGDGIFKAEMQAPLAPGQYAFVLAGSKGTKYGGTYYRVYDFR
jgi:hypothetical protein